MELIKRRDNALPVYATARRPMMPASSHFPPDVSARLLAAARIPSPEQRMHEIDAATVWAREAYPEMFAA